MSDDEATGPPPDLKSILLMGKRSVRDSSLFVPGASPGQAAEIQEAVRRQEGTLLFSLDPTQLYSQQGDFSVVRIPTGAVLIEVTRDSQGMLQFMHASPGTGTRIATVELPEFTADRPFLVVLTWSPVETGMHAGFQSMAPVMASGSPSRESVRLVGGAVFEMDTDRVMSYQVVQDGELALRESAIESWRSVGKAVDVHLRSEPTEGQLGKTVQANLAIVMLATGVETFLARRFEEIEREGREADLPAFIKALVPARFRAEYSGLSLYEVLAQRRPDFGNLEQAKRSYRAAYGFRFGAIGLSPATLSSVRQLLDHRNRIVHVSPLLGLLNGPAVPPAEPVFAVLETAKSLQVAADDFVQAVLSASLTSSGPPSSADEAG